MSIAATQLSNSSTNSEQQQQLHLLTTTCSHLHIHGRPKVLTTTTTIITPTTKNDHIDSVGGTDDTTMTTTTTTITPGNYCGRTFPPGTRTASYLPTPNPTQLFIPLGGHKSRWSNSSYIFPDGITSIVKTTSLYEGALYAYLFFPLSIGAGNLASTQLANLVLLANDPRQTCPENISPMNISTTLLQRPEQTTTTTTTLQSQLKSQPEISQWRNRLYLADKISPSDLESLKQAENDLKQFRRFVPRVNSVRLADDTNALCLVHLNKTGTGNETDQDLVDLLSYDTFMRSKCYIEMENLVGIDYLRLSGRCWGSAYCAMDLKVGTRFWGLDAGKEKRERMNRKAEITTAAKTGLCLIAYKCIDAATGQIACQMTREETRRITTAEALYAGLRSFFSMAPRPVLRMIGQEVQDLLDLFRRQKTAHFHSSSLLIIYDPAGIWPMKLKLIDFEHASLYHFERDESFLTGLTNFSHFLTTLDPGMAMAFKHSGGFG